MGGNGLTKSHFRLLGNCTTALHLGPVGPWTGLGWGWVRGEEAPPGPSPSGGGCGRAQWNSNGVVESRARRRCCGMVRILSATCVDSRGSQFSICPSTGTGLSQGMVAIQSRNWNDTRRGSHRRGDRDGYLGQLLLPWRTSVPSSAWCPLAALLVWISLGRSLWGINSRLLRSDSGSRGLQSTISRQPA